MRKWSVGPCPEIGEAMAKGFHRSIPIDATAHSAKIIVYGNTPEDIHIANEIVTMLNGYEEAKPGTEDDRLKALRKRIEVIESSVAGIYVKLERELTAKLYTLKTDFDKVITPIHAELKLHGARGKDVRTAVRKLILSLEEIKVGIASANTPRKVKPKKVTKPFKPAKKFKTRTL